MLTSKVPAPLTLSPLRRIYSSLRNNILIIPTHIRLSEGFEVHHELLRAEDLEGGGELVEDEQLAVWAEALVVDRHLDAGSRLQQPFEGTAVSHIRVALGEKHFPL